MAKKKNATKIVLWAIAGLVVLLIVAGVVGKFVFGGSDAARVEVAEASERDITQVVTASGKVQPEIEVKISQDVSGEIVDMRIKEGQQVKRGDLLLRIDPDFYEAQLERARAGVLQVKATAAQRKADLLNAELELKRQEKLFESGSISESDYQKATTQFEVASAALEAAQYSVQSSEANLKEAQEQVAKTSIYSPMDGTVSMLEVEVGERVVGTSQFAGTEMLRIAQLGQMEIEVDINENDVVNVVLGDSASIEIDAYPEQTFRGVVTEIANSARVTGQGTQEQVTNFPVKVRILDVHNTIAAGMARITAAETASSEPPNFRPGMSGTVDVYTHTVEDAVAVPIQAVTVRDMNKVKRDMLLKERRRNDGDSSPDGGSDPDGGSAPDSLELARYAAEDLQKVVFVVEDGKVALVRVETGISDDTHIQIRSGLEGGETVVVGPYRAVSRTLEDGADVEIQKDLLQPAVARAGA